MTSVCIALALGAVVATIPTERFTLAWTHSVEKIRWEEDYVVRRRGLEAVAARIRGNAAGMEVPEGAVLRDGAWHYVPHLGVLPALHLARSTYTPDYEICREGRCRTIAQLLPGGASGESVEIRPCRPADNHSH